VSQLRQSFRRSRQATRLLGYLLYKLSPRDPLAFGVIPRASVVASLIRPWRAVRADPVLALRAS